MLQNRNFAYWVILLAFMSSADYFFKINFFEHYQSTVNTEIFARILFSQNFAYAYAKFRENKILANWRNHSVLYMLIMPSSRIFNSAKMSFNAIRENKILTKNF